MNQVSTNLTLFYRIFLPVFFGVFLGAMVGFLWLYPQAYYANIQGSVLRWTLTLIFAGMALFYFFTFWKIRRVEMNKEWVYATDFLRQARYPWSNVELIKESSLGIIKLVHIRLIDAGQFGSKITFIASNSRWQLFKESNPDRFADLMR